jgi:hypothetical protein
MAITKSMDALIIRLSKEKIIRFIFHLEKY